MPDEKEFTLDKIKNIHNSAKISKFYKIYNEFHNQCTHYRVDRNESCYPEVSKIMIDSSDVIDLLKKLYSNLYKVHVTIKYTNNTYFDDLDDEDYKLYYTALKYWLYDQIIIKDLEEGKINEIFKGWENYIKEKITIKFSNSGVFNKLTLAEIKRLKNIYALYTVLYDNDKFETCNENTCKYLDYVGKGLDHLIISIDSCSIKSNQTYYCNELKEFVDLCKEDNVYSGISIYQESKKDSADTAGKYLLSVKTYENEPHYIYIKNENLLNYVKTSDFLSNKSTTIAATSVVGSAIGLSSIFYYFYKFTPFGSTLRKGKGKNLVNIEERANDSLLYTQVTEQMPFKNREYKVAYHTFNDT